MVKTLKVQKFALSVAGSFIIWRGVFYAIRVHGRSAHNVYETFKRFDLIKEAGYNLVYIWEYDFLNLL